MRAGLTDHLWCIEEVVLLLECEEKSLTVERPVRQGAVVAKRCRTKCGDSHNSVGLFHHQLYAIVLKRIAVSLGQKD